MNSSFLWCGKWFKWITNNFDNRFCVRVCAQSPRHYHRWTLQLSVDCIAAADVVDGLVDGVAADSDNFGRQRSYRFVLALFWAFYFHDFVDMNVRNYVMRVIVMNYDDIHFVHKSFDLDAMT